MLCAQIIKQVQARLSMCGTLRFVNYILRYLATQGYRSDTSAYSHSLSSRNLLLDPVSTPPVFVPLVS